MYYIILKDIEEKVINSLFNDKYNRIDVNREIFKLLDKRIGNNIKYNINEDDFLNIIDMYYELYHKYDFNYFLRIANNSNCKLDYYKIFKKLNK